LKNTIKLILCSILKDDDGTYSGTKVVSAICLFVFLVVSVYLAYNGMEWRNYESFSTATGLGGIGLRGANKFMNIKKYENGGE
jgi:hypothetical protein